MVQAALRVPFLMQIPRLKLPGKPRAGTSLLARVASESGSARVSQIQSRACCYARLKVNFDFEETGETAFPPSRCIRRARRLQYRRKV